MEVSEYLTELAAVTRRAGIERTARRIGVYPSTVAFFCDHPESAPPLVVSRIAATADRIRAGGSRVGVAGTVHATPDVRPPLLTEGTLPTLRTSCCCPPAAAGRATTQQP